MSISKFSGKSAKNTKPDSSPNKNTNIKSFEELKGETP